MTSLLQSIGVKNPIQLSTDCAKEAGATAMVVWNRWTDLDTDRHRETDRQTETD